MTDDKFKEVADIMARAERLRKDMAPVLARNAALAARWQETIGPTLARSATLAAQWHDTIAPVLARNAALVSRWQESIGPVLARNAALAADWQDTIGPVLARNASLAARWQETLGPLLANWETARKVYSEQWRHISAALERWDAEQELMSILVPRGWLIAPDLPISTTRRLLTIRRENGLRALNESLIRLFSPAYCARLLRATYSRPAFRRWRPTLEKAMRAHRRRDFALAIPIWLMAIDGVAQEELSKPALFSNMGKRKRAEIAKALETGGLRSVLLDAWLDVIVGISGNRPGATTVPVLVVDRHAVLHGSRPRVGGERDSIQCILVLHLLHYFLTTREAEAAA